MARESRLRFSGSGLHSLPRWKVAQAPMRFALGLSIEEVGREGPREALQRSTTESEMPLSSIDQIAAFCGHKRTLLPENIQQERSRGTFSSIAINGPNVNSVLQIRTSENRPRLLIRFNKDLVTTEAHQRWNGFHEDLRPYRKPRCRTLGPALNPMARTGPAHSAGIARPTLLASSQCSNPRVPSPC